MFRFPTLQPILASPQVEKQTCSSLCDGLAVPPPRRFLLATPGVNPSSLSMTSPMRTHMSRSPRNYRWPPIPFPLWLLDYANSRYQPHLAILNRPISRALG